MFNRVNVSAWYTLCAMLLRQTRTCSVCSSVSYGVPVYAYGYDWAYFSYVSDGITRISTITFNVTPTWLNPGYLYGLQVNGVGNAPGYISWYSVWYRTLTFTSTQEII